MKPIILTIVLQISISLSIFSISKESIEIGKNGQIPIWNLCGPFHETDKWLISTSYFTPYLENVGGEANISPDNHKTINYCGKEYQWRIAFADSSGSITIPHDTAKDESSYAFCIINSDRDREITINYSAKKSMLIWLNGKLIDIYFRNFDNPKSTTIKLFQGENKLLIKSKGFSLLIENSDAIREGIIAQIFSEEPLLSRVFGFSVQLTDQVINSEEGKRQIANVYIESGGLGQCGLNVHEEFNMIASQNLGILEAGAHNLQILLPVSDSGKELSAAVIYMKSEAATCKIDSSPP